MTLQKIRFIRFAFSVPLFLTGYFAIENFFLVLAQISKIESCGNQLCDVSDLDLGSKFYQCIIFTIISVLGIAFRYILDTEYHSQSRLADLKAMKTRFTPDLQEEYKDL